MMDSRNLGMRPQDHIVRIMNRIYARGMTTTSGGNISIKDENGDVWITPAMVDKGSLQPDDMVCIKKDGTIAGRHKPSSEFPFHKAIYTIRPDIKVIVHAHPPALVAFSIIRKVPDTTVMINAAKVCGPVGYATYEQPGSKALGENIATAFKKGYNVIIMENHGTVVGASDPETCHVRFETLEYCARTLLHGYTLGTPLLPDGKMDSPKDESKSESLSSVDIINRKDTAVLRAGICSIVARACRQGLMAGSFGTVSTRLNHNNFLITPAGISRWDLDEDDMVYVINGSAEKHPLPDANFHLHYEIYRSHARVNSIIQTCPPHIMAFGITHTPVNVRTIPESWMYLQDLPSVSYESYVNDQAVILSMINKQTPAVLIQHDSILVTGDSLLQTFDRLEVAEFSAMSLLMAKPAGEFIPISNTQVDELKRLFFKESDGS